MIDVSKVGELLKTRRRRTRSLSTHPIYLYFIKDIIILFNFLKSITDISHHFLKIFTTFPHHRQ